VPGWTSPIQSRADRSCRHFRQPSVFEIQENPMSQLQPSNAAETYERYFVPAMFIPWATILLRYASPKPVERVLDVACGTGIVARLAAPLVGSNGQVVALDINPAMLAVARAHPAPSGATIQWQEGNALALPSPDGAFDVVLCQHGLQFVPDRASAVREMRRVLAPGGRALVIVLQALARHPVFEALIESVARHLSQPVSAVMTPFALCDADELQALFTAAGFGKVDILPESTTVRFPEPERFVPLAVISSAAAVPAFTQLGAPARDALLETVRAEVEPTVRRYRNADFVTFPMFAYVARATK
jgi:ubiquinone/menaquinone biosynthesis C-methylase UbiE